MGKPVAHKIARTAALAAALVLLHAVSLLAEDGEQRGGLEEIVVTAQKREQNIQDVPISVTALTEKFILDAGLTDFNAIAQYTPNVFINPVTDTRSTAIRIRGIGSDQTNAGIDPSVGVFLDGIYQGRTGLMASNDLVDIERIETLRGPQGTLFGKNTAAGAFNITTNKPTFEYEGLLELQYGKYNRREVRGMVNVPLPIFDEKVAMRLTGYATKRDYYDRNLSGGGRNDSDKNGFRFRTLIEPTEDFNLVISADYGTSQSECCAFDIVTYDGPPALDVTFAPFDQDILNVGALTEVTGRPLPAVVDPFDRVVDANAPTIDDTQLWGVSLEANYNLADYAFKLLVAHREFDSLSAFDADASGYDAVFQNTDETFEQWSGELQLISPGGEDLEYTVGAYFYYHNDKTVGRLGIAPEWIETSPGLGPVIGTGVDENGDAYNIDTNRHETWSYALFGQGTYNFNEQWSVIIGLRGTYEEKSRVGTQRATFEGVDAGPFGPPRDLDESRGVFNLSPMGVLQYRPTDDANLFAKVARGFKSGGFNQFRTTGGDNTEFDDEEATDFEFGVRTTWLDNMVTLNGTFFYTIYDEFQAQAFDGSGLYVTNAGSLTSYGIETEAFIAPHPMLIIGAAGGWNVAEYDDFPDSPCTVEQTWAKQLELGGIIPPSDPCFQDLSGRRLDNAPRFTTTMFSQLTFPLGITDFLDYPVNGHFRFEYNYRDFVFLSQDLEPNLTQGPVHLMNLRAGFAPEDGNWDVIFWGKNVLDQRWAVVGIDIPIVSGFGVVNAPPREWGATVRVFF